MENLRLWRIELALHVSKSVLCHLNALREVEADVAVPELVEFCERAMPRLHKIPLGLRHLKGKMAALLQATALNQLLVSGVNVRHQPNPSST